MDKHPGELKVAMAMAASIADIPQLTSMITCKEKDGGQPTNE